MKVLVTGSSGQLAKAIQSTWTGHDLLMPPESELDLADREALRRVISGVRPDVVLNLGAYTAVDKAESEPDRAMLVNGTTVGWLAEACDEVNALLVQISTDYVFDGKGTRPYREDDPTGPCTVYGRTKLAGEQAAATARQHLIVRTAWLYDAWGKNFLDTMLRVASEGRSLRVVNDQQGSPTTCRCLARQLQAALDGGWRGLFHGTCGGDTTWYHFAEAIFRTAGIKADLSPCASAEYPVPAPRPAYSVLDNSKRRGSGPDLMLPWEEALAEVLADRIPRH